MIISLALLFAAAEFGVPVPTVEPVVATRPSVVASSVIKPVPPIVTTSGQVIPSHEAVITSTMTFDFDDDGWVTYSDGSVKCVAAAPCGASHDLPPDAYTYNYETGVYHAVEITHEGSADG